VAFFGTVAIGEGLEMASGAINTSGRLDQAGSVAEPADGSSVDAGMDLPHKGRGVIGLRLVAEGDLVEGA
jgi:hypothetical protein